MGIFTFCPLDRDRTYDHSLKRRVLYQLSYERNYLKNNKCYFFVPKTGVGHKYFSAEKSRDPASRQTRSGFRPFLGFK